MINNSGIEHPYYNVTNMKSQITILALLLFALVAFQQHTIIEQNERISQLQGRQIEILKLLAQQDTSSRELLGVVNDFIPKQRSFNRDIKTALDSEKFQSIVDWVSLEMKKQ